VVFLAPHKDDIQNLASILEAFGEVASLLTNIQKSSGVPIYCGDLNLEDILEGLPELRSKFPMRYLGLTLSVWQLKRVDFQHLEDKLARKSQQLGMENSLT
jgi:hypothetical protein